MKKILFSILTLLMLLAGICLQDGLAQDIITISGNVTSGGAALAGVIMNGLPGNPKTNGDGYYTATVSSPWSGTVKPQKIGYAIHPFVRVYTEVTSPIQQDYTATVLPKAAVVLDKETGPTTYYYVGEPIIVKLTINNAISEIITTQGFTNKDFNLALRFTDPDKNLITANLPVGAVLPTHPNPPIIVTPGAEPIQVENVERVLQGWVWSNTFDALDYYTLTKPGNYSVKAKFSMSDYLEFYETASGSGVYYSPLASGSSGDVESNVVSFTLLPSGVPTKLAFGVQPSNTTVGVTISPPVTVQILDSNGNLTWSTAPVTLAIANNPGGGTLSGTIERNAVNGVATFADLSINKVGNGYTLVASDSGLTGATSSAFNITIYNFTGFGAPVANPPAVNTLIAASTVPVKWQITDTNGVGVSDPGSFINLTSSQVSCKNWKNPKDTRSESEGLVYLGDGNWKFEWKTSKNFAGTCRIMTIKLKDDTEHEARFQFIK